ncbi:Aste57867_24389 [Aphanomyces stellatus]|uniref:Aste57867_24389 protein n=1 Tax=Aphanomyces stellatus TaxID=120398 RepID=A0A485LQ84_9STRA|nr:hypothetical protein As57867_024313 [Aphanomyces stellatus]VFU01029.1 Aste57867_24389 [Aphanomyces stellatus]
MLPTRTTSDMWLGDDWIMIEDDESTYAALDDDDFTSDKCFMQSDMQKALDALSNPLEWSAVDWHIEATTTVHTIDVLVSSTIECFLCQHEIHQPTAAPCCGFVYCRDCILQWVAESGSCPCCFDDLTSSQLCNLGVPDEDNIMPAAMSWHLDLVAAARMDLDAMARFLLAPLPPTARAIHCAIGFHDGKFSLMIQDSGVVLATATQYAHADAFVAHSIFPFNMATPIVNSCRNASGSEFTLRTSTGPPTDVAALHIVSGEDSCRHMLATLASLDDDVGFMRHFVNKVDGECNDESFTLISTDKACVEALWFGRAVDGQSWAVSFSYPFSPVQAFGVALGSLLSYFETC